MDNKELVVAGGGSAIRSLNGWGRYPVERCHVFRPEGQAEVAAILASGAQPTYVSRGLGRSYGDAALNRGGGIICHIRLNRFLSFEASSGILECEAGVSFAEILQYFLPRGFFPPVTPGTKFVTIGGAIAADVHGKNHHRDGTFANFILDFKLLTSAGQFLVCSRTQNPEVFWATVGGMGLTGIIQSARIQLRRVESAYVVVDYQKARNLEEAAGLMSDSDKHYQYSVAWIDCLATGNSLGRAVLMRGNHATRAQLPGHIRNPLAERPRFRWAVPCDFPSAALNSLTVGLFNACYFGLHRDFGQQLVDFQSFFYPLDSIQNWNRVYGKRGFVQYQIVLPYEGRHAGLGEILTRLAQSRRASFLGVLKRFGQANPGLLSFPFEGYTLALDLPMDPELVPFLHELDRLVLSYGGRVYLAKDAVLGAHNFAGMYPRLRQFREIKRKLDPAGLLSSSLARRLAI
jgi:decaprenylphospho-beta-D-ribofuranose 2-oxidase